MTTQASGGLVPRGRLRAAWTAFVERPTPLVFALALIAQLLALAAMQRFEPSLVAVAIVVGALVPLALGSVSRVLALFVVVLMAVPRVAKWPFMPIEYSDLFAIAFMLLAALLVVRDRLDRGDFTVHPRSLAPIWVALVGWSVFIVAYGLLRETNVWYFRYEFVQMCLYGTFFLALDALRRPADFRLLLAALLVGLGAVCGEYVVAAMTQGAGELRWGRVLSRQANLTLAVAPMLVGLYLTGGSRAWMWLVGFVPISVIAMLSQQRSLFAALIVAIGVSLFMAFFAPSVGRRRIGALFLAMALAGAVAWGTVDSLRASSGGPSVTEGLSERTEEVSSAGGAPALLIRLVSFMHVWNEKITERPVTGWGLGDGAEIPVLRGASFSVMRVDNAFVVLVWKSGFVGLGLVLLLWGAVLYRAWRLVRNPHREAQVVAIGVAGALSSVLVLSLAAAVITHYRFNAIWGLMMGAVIAAERVYAWRRPPPDAE